MSNYLARRNTNLFDEALDAFFKPTFFNMDNTVMKTDIKETRTVTLWRQSMPGFKKEDIRISHRRRLRIGQLPARRKRRTTTSISARSAACRVPEAIMSEMQRRRTSRLNSTTVFCRSCFPRQRKNCPKSTRQPLNNLSEEAGLC